MSSRVNICGALLLCGGAVAAVQAAGISQQQANDFTRKMALVKQQSTTPVPTAVKGPRRTPFSEAEVNSWFTYHGQEVLPPGVTEPRVVIVGGGKVKAAATVDLEAVAKRRSNGGALDPWSYLGGKLPVTLSGMLHTQDGVGRFEIEDAAISGVPVPRSMLEEVVAYYSRTADDPDGIRLDDPFKLPAKIKQIEVGEGQAVVVQ